MIETTKIIMNMSMQQIILKQVYAINIRLFSGLWS
jgi:hypothetical protein